ncbi:ATP-binding protein [Sphingomonas gei]|uniref:ATP-binding protein n=1 Tax=Sphingomonas gei TaxID=1395960 RepID=A0A4S1XB23_9SPHN|nr:ATP-binding protein [Sphingomonas gei]TGX53529.1 ATP-binding protein [Sphingomonas gei]
MQLTGPEIVCTDDLAPFFGSVPQSSHLLFYAVTGFEIPSLPALSPEGAQKGDVVGAVLYRFRSFISELHQPGRNRSIALQFASRPDESHFNARVRCHILLRSAQPDAESAKREVAAFAEQARRTFPQEGIFAYGSPHWMDRAELARALFEGGAVPIDIVEIRKFEDVLTAWSQPSMQYVPHRFWADNRRDPWLSIIETLSQTSTPTAVRVELQPVQLSNGQGLDFIALAGRWFSVITEDLTRKASQGEQVRTDGVVTEEMMRAELVATASANASTISYIHRGRHIYERLTTYADTVFTTRVTLAARGQVPEAVIGSVRSALSNPPPDDEAGAIGWNRPGIARPAADERDEAVESFRMLTQSRWGRSPPNAASPYKVDLGGVVTPDEAVSLFHVPIYDRPGQTSALSTAEAPFVIPPETLARDRFAEAGPEKPEGSEKKASKADKVMIGYMYQREKLLGPDAEGGAGLPFCVTLGDLMKPSLLVGAPGSGKTNLAFSLLIQLWRDHKVPFLVLDPSTGQEFRMLMRDASLKEDLVVYTVGDRDECPLQFNPFSVPPGVTVRNHATRILAAFRAAFQMFDPVPAIYEGALERIYTDPRYAGGHPPMRMDQKGGLDSFAPTLASFAEAIRDEVNEKAVSLYEGSKESIGVIRGASTIRVNAIGKKVGHIINVEGNNGEFMQKLLRRPVVIEMGGLGDSSNISLVMAFLLTQLAGHIEWAYRKDESRIHVMFIEEAHRLLGGGEGEGVEGKSAEDLNMMLAEVRKFGQGILVMDQRPSSLVGGVLDNSYIKILTRLSDRPGFERLANELNLNDAQQRYARTRLKTGDAIVIDRDAGQPVLMRSEDAKGPLEKGPFPNEDLIAQMRANAEAKGLVPPEAAPYVEPGNAHDGADGAPGEAAAKSGYGGAQGWLDRRSTAGLKQLVDSYLGDSKVYYTISDSLTETQDPAAAKQALERCFAERAAGFDTLSADLREMLQWALIGRIAETQFPKAIAARVEALRDASAEPPR